MNNKNGHKNRKSPRLQTWDYRSQAAYFSTICTKNKECYFDDNDPDTTINATIVLTVRA